MNIRWREGEPVSPDGRRTIRVLLADDHHAVRRALAALLEAEPGIQVVAEASDGADAIALAREHEPDVVVLDVSMPRMNGIEAAKHLAAEMPAVRIIGLSMHARADMAQAMQTAGAAAYLTKGEPIEGLVAAICADEGR